MIFDCRELDDPLHFDSRDEPQRHRSDDAEETVAADDAAEQIGARVQIAFHDLAAREHELQRFDVVDETA